ncbi:hypothetical protein K2173_021216 [Erythroxylum novogranatense]|uniref:mitogen-activated protein kinase kinase kinase n=1 Tax=Erythroxylum novogranatense TaxID=1862640 RepID=A0AAV8TMY6_9ROSI|nr:hypothetical protein K2173_021216 [Erythroxylum novogranatense]
MMMADLFSRGHRQSEKQSETSSNRVKPKLDRRNAVKNIDYDASSSSSSSNSWLVKNPWVQYDQKTSFRIKGIEGEFDRICQTLGFSGPEDFAIPTAVWEAQKPRSSFFSTPSSPQLNDHDLPISLQAKLMLNNDALLPSFDIARTKDGIPPTITREAIASGIKGQRPTALVISDEEQGHIGMVEGEERIEAESFSAANTLGFNMDPTFIILANGKFMRSITSWQKGELLGSGTFGTVYEGFTDDGFFFAVKEVSLLDQGSHAKQSILQLEQEISLLRQFKHENIIQYLGTDKDESKLYIFLELATKGSLSRLYEKYHLWDSQVSVYTRQILSGLKYLHDQKVVHRDIKCANILVDASGSVKLADFGLAKAAKFNDVRSSKGTPFWMAPEVVNLRNRGYGLPADIWSLGCTVLEMLTGRPPYSHLEGMQALFRIGKGEPPEVPDTLSRDAQNFILKCLQVNPNDRPSAAQLLDHPFVKRPSQSFSTPPSPYIRRTRS